MNEMRSEKLDAYLSAAESWADDRALRSDRSRRTAWIIASGAAAIAVLEAIAIVVMLPLKTVEPYTLLVDRQTGYVQELKPLQREIIAPDAALTRSFLVQYVIARESFDINALKENYRKVGLWSVGEARTAYANAMQASNPASPLATLPRRALVNVQIKSVSPLGAGTALVRYATARSDLGAPAQPPQSWAAVSLVLRTLRPVTARRQVPQVRPQSEAARKVVAAPTGLKRACLLMRQQRCPRASSFRQSSRPRSIPTGRGRPVR